MRTIKFRVFHKNDDSTWVNNVGDGFGWYGDIYTNGDETISLPDDSNPDYIYAQFTGLKDKNGVEIYELCELDNRYIVVYIAPKFVLYDILKNDILDIYEQATITKEYCELSKDQKRVINKYIS